MAGAQRFQHDSKHLRASGCAKQEQHGGCHASRSGLRIPGGCEPIKKRPGNACHLAKCGGAGGIRTHGPGRVNRFRVCPVMTASIPLRIYPLPRSPGNRREQQERTNDSIRAFAARKVLRRQGFPAIAFREGFTISSQPLFGTS